MSYDSLCALTPRYRPLYRPEFHRHTSATPHTCPAIRSLSLSLIPSTGSFKLSCSHCFTDWIPLSHCLTIPMFYCLTISLSLCHFPSRNPDQHHKSAPTSTHQHPSAPTTAPTTASNPITTAPTAPAPNPITTAPTAPVLGTPPVAFVGQYFGLPQTSLCGQLSGGCAVCTDVVLHGASSEVLRV